MKAKKSFILYRDALCILDDLTDAQAGKLFKAIRAYHEEEEVKLEPIVKMAFVPIRNQFARDAVKYAEMLEKRAIAGKKGGYQKQANLASASKCQQTVANLPDTDTVIETETVIDNKAIAESHMDHLNNIYGAVSQRDIPEIFELIKKIPDPPEIFELIKKIPDPAEFGRIAKELHSQAVKPFVPGALRLCQNVFAEINKPEAPADGGWTEPF